LREHREAEGVPIHDVAQSSDIQAAANHAVLLVSEVLALLFALPFGDALFHDRPISGWHIFYLALGLMFAIGGPMWPAIRPRIPAVISSSLTRIALDARLLIAALLLIFLYVLVGPEIYRRFTDTPPKQFSADEIAAAVVSKLPKIAESQTSVPASAQSPPKLSKNYFPDEKLELGKLLSTISARLDDGIKTANTGIGVRIDRQQTKDQFIATHDVVMRARDEIASMSNQLWNDVLKNNNRYYADLVDVIGSNSADNVPVGRFYRVLDTAEKDISAFIQKYDVLSPDDRKWIIDFIKRDDIEILNRSSDFLNWAYKARTQIDSKRDLLK
jgi:hypothetical protein